MEELVNPQEAMFVFVLPIHISINERPNHYEATRFGWEVSENNRMLSPVYAVGIVNEIFQTSYEILNWQITATDRNVWEFISPNHPNPEIFEPLQNLNWRNIIMQAEAHWKFGNYLIVEFDGNGRFRIVRGSRNRDWNNCI